MRRVFFTAVASSALALAVPGVASAQHGKRHHSHRASSHKRHHRHAHIVRFGTLATASTPSSSASSPATPSSPAGTVASFTGGVLTITLADKSTVSGKVTEQTELECQSPAPTASASSHDGGDDGDRHDSSTSTSSQQAGSQSGDDEQGDDQGEDQGDDEQGAQQSCTTAALETRAVVQEAELSISSAGAVWHKIELG
ncbi:MAG TPA: hypothetical protein VK538_10560 [Solirubrobacteraceae bacterium]|nr:hypothetical protein [Solirubrobacteraceae bacterium]